VGLSAPGLEKAQEFRFSGDRLANKASFVQAALEILIESLQELAETHGSA
jgi:nicotinamide mononucleotide (NMN) deamidase PncC